MTALKYCKESLEAIAKAQEECCERGCVKDSHRYQYQVLERQKARMEESLEWMQSKKGV